MPLMVQGIVNGKGHCWSDEPVDIIELYGPGAPDYVYLPRVCAIDEVRFGSNSPHGGYVRLTYGTLTLLHTVFTTRVGDWPPPRRIPIAVWYTTAPQHTKLFEGTAQIDRMTDAGVVYALRPYDEFTVETEEKEYKGTLLEIFAEACVLLGVTLDATGARVNSPQIQYVAKGKQLLIDSLHHMASWTCHRFWVDDGVLYLSDLFLARGSDIQLRSYGVRSSSYTFHPPYRAFSADYVQPFVQDIRLFIKAVDAGSAQAVIAGAKIARSVGGPLIPPDAIAASSAQSGNPASAMLDTDPNTVWANEVTVAPTNMVGDREPVTVAMAVSTGTIAEYALSARAAAPYWMPSRWNLYGNDVHANRYKFLSTVESLDWGSLEERRFPVPTDVNWGIEVPGSYYYGDVFHVSPACSENAQEIWATVRVIGGVVERPVIEVAIPIPELAGGGPLSTPPQLGQRIYLHDTSLTDDATGLPVTSAWFHVDGIGYDFTNHMCLVYGSGAIASAADVMPAAAVSVYRFEQLIGWQFTDHLDVGFANALTAAGGVACSTAESIEGLGCARLPPDIFPFMYCEDGQLIPSWPYKGGSANTTMTLSMRVRLQYGYAGEAALLAQKWSNGGFKLTKDITGALTVSVWDTAERTATAGMPPAGSWMPPPQWNHSTWYHVVLQLSLQPTSMMGVSGCQWAISVYDEGRDYWLIYPTGGTFGVASMATTGAEFQIGGGANPLYGWVDEVCVFASILSLDDLIQLRERTYVELYA